MDYIDKKIRGFHLDLYGHVNNARYLEFLEEARWEMLEDHFDFPKLAALGYQFVVVNLQISYIFPLKLADIIRVETTVKNISNASFTVHQQIKSQTAGKLAADALVTLVILNSETLKPVLLEGDLLENLQLLPSLQTKPKKTE